MHLTSSSGQPARAAPIEALRAVSALAVAAFHFQLDVVHALPQAHVPDLIRGAAGVDIFFVISGFVIARSAAAMQADQGAGYFFGRRLIRIVPLYWSVTLLYLALAVLLPDRGNTFSLPLVLSSFAFIPFPRTDGFIQPVIGQGWSLNYEMLFYAIYACCIGLSRQRAGWLAIAALVLVAIAGLWPSESPQIEFWTSGIMLEFAAGIVLAEVFARGLRLTRAPAVAIATLGVALILFAPLSPAEFGASRVFWVGIPALLLVGSIALADRPLIPESRWVLLLGAASYAIYLLHSLPNRVVVSVITRLGLDPGAPAVFLSGLVIALTGTLVLSIIVYIAFERPVMRRLQERLAKRYRNGRAMAAATDLRDNARLT
jgi:peptidoglycan/LPS O-acetylase OafA/YrhL